MTTRRTLAGAAAAAVLGLLVPAAADAVGPTPGVALGGNGTSWQGHAERFVAAPAANGTRVTELRRAGGATLRSRTIPGRFGIPIIAYDGSTEQVPATSPAVVVAGRSSPAALARRTASWCSRRVTCTSYAGSR